jgi:hypothetical protein
MIALMEHIEIMDKDDKAVVFSQFLGIYLTLFFRNARSNLT